MLWMGLQRAFGGEDARGRVHAVRIWSTWILTWTCGVQREIGV